MEEIKTPEVEPDSDGEKKCAPGITYDGISCIDLQILIEMAHTYNEMADNSSKIGRTKLGSSDNKIILYPQLETLSPRNYKKYLVKHFKMKLDNDQRKWFKHTYMKNLNKIHRLELEKFTIRPSFKDPDSRFKWLSTSDINDVLNQYEMKYNDFFFLGTHPRDFNEVSVIKKCIIDGNTIYSFHAEKLVSKQEDVSYIPFSEIEFDDIEKAGKHRLGMVFNTSESDGSGEHWNALYADLKKKQIYFFDSYGVEPCRETRQFMNRIAKYLISRDNSTKITVEHSKTQHQQLNSECGVYSMVFILRMLRGDSFANVCSKRMADKLVNKCRNKYFNNVQL